MSTIHKLVVVVGKNKGRIFELEAGENIIGRGDPDDEEVVAVDLDEEDLDAKVSRQHAVVMVDDAEVSVEDLGSLNGTYLAREGGTKLQAGQTYVIQPNDEVIVGKISLRYVRE